ncbi:hypothetical protein SAZ10_11555 [Mesorhizobium sp. BAC0120]|uniref:hypothetical protein n=1 Tax=Mesorhizobium sp. BAC0120 TaxID=3090670 RepID=UPI00298C8D56|nr:hypothetical protein [Mesorhizobium sp. BAC0120]MDW6022390.1 hypothetical protein [Mesorhizobium sp. BAC0120]
MLSLFVFAGTAFSADGWARYLNPRYGYGVDIPPGFSPVSESDNSDGGTSRSADGQAELAVWGANLLNDTLPSDVESRIHSSEDGGWKITYSKLTGKWASWSGERDGRIFYARAIQLCQDDQAGYFQLEYPASQRQAFDPLVDRLVKGFKHTICE